MPQQNARGIDVSKEEEQYLRSAFRRFALPYVIVFAVLAWATTTVMSKDSPTAAGEDVTSVREKVAALEQSIATLEGRLSKMDSEFERAGARMGALENRKPGIAERAASNDTSDLEHSLRDATRRISDLERRGGSGASTNERIDALATRVQRIEGIARAAVPSAPSAAPAPAPAAPAAP
jgi:predicted RNase H-like nuclease (RuvC/YqgF family)